jgi:endonuclease/exonuclease/phosphatase family metal-dependent hydrolase
MRALVLLALSLPAAAQTSLEPAYRELRAAPFSKPAPAAKPWTITVLSYNIHGIVLANGTPEEKQAAEAQALSRFREIARRLREMRKNGTAPKLVAIQEAFHLLSNKAAKESGYPHIVSGGGMKPGRGKAVGSGLYILSEYPVLRQESIDFGSKDCTGWDCWANKGAQRVRVSVPELGTTLDFYNTHMNADQDDVPEAESRAMRLKQARQFAEWIAATRGQNAPTVIAGDFNFRKGAEDYELFGALTGAANAGEACERSGSCSGDAPGPVLGGVDHLYTLGALAPEDFRQTWKEPYNGEPMSDHWGLEARFAAP